MNSALYFDYAAATPLDPFVLEQMTPYFTDKFYNPSVLYLPARAVRQDVEAARAVVAQKIGARPSEIIFTAGGTEANNLAIIGVLSQFPDAHVVLSPLEHDSVYEPAVRYAHSIIAVDETGVVDPVAIASAVTDQTVLVTVIYVQNEIGTIQPLRQVRNLLDEIKKERRRKGNMRPLLLHADACQAPLYVDINVARLGVDLMTINGGKMYGPKHTGALYVKAGVTLQPILWGGGQERGLRSGTENVAGIVGFSTALTLADGRRREAARRVKALQKQFLQQMPALLPTARINGSLKLRSPNNIHISIPGTDNERVMMKLEALGCIVAAGSACSASAHKPSRVLAAIGVSDTEAQSSLRITLGAFTEQESINQLVISLKTAIH